MGENLYMRFFKNLDYKAIIDSIWLPVLFWFSAVIFVSILGQPGIICVSPVAWLLAFSMGWRYGGKTRTPGSSQYTIEACLVGFSWGFLVGILIFIVSLIAFRDDYLELHQMMVWGTVFSIAGILVCAALSFLGAHFRLKKKTKPG
jgi:hypothetical protein